MPIAHSVPTGLSVLSALLFIAILKICPPVFPLVIHIFSVILSWFSTKFGLDSSGLLNVVAVPLHSIGPVFSFVISELLESSGDSIKIAVREIFELIVIVNEAVEISTSSHL